MAKAKKQQASPQPPQPQAPAKPAIPPAQAQVEAKTSAQPAASRSSEPKPTAVQAPATPPAETQPTQAKSSKKGSVKKGGTAVTADSSNAAPKQTPKPAAAAKPAPPRAPMIDTNLAAAAAASMVVHRDIATSVAPTAPESGTAPAQPAPQRQESASFKQLKQGLSKPAGSVGNLLGTPPGQKKSNLPFGGQKQNFRNQTFGADVNRSGVPRRTGG